MPFLVKDLIDEHRKPVTAQADDSLQAALTRMTEHDYSQLPIVDAENHYLGMVTSDSILRALKTFAVAPAHLLVRDAKIRVSTYREDDDLFQLLDDLRDSYAVPILDEERHVVGVVTGYDATEYFRRRTEDMMFVEDIEIMLKDYILASHTNGSGEVDDTALEQSIQQCARGASTARKRFFAALQRYLDQQPQANGSARPHLNPTLASEIFAQVFENDAPKSLDELTFADFVELLTSKGQWPHYVNMFHPRTPEDMRHMLDAIRETRNVLAHFRGEVTPEEHERLKFCLDWLREHPAVHLSVDTEHAADVNLSGTLYPTETVAGELTIESEANDGRMRADEAIDERDSQYAPLALFLMGQGGDRDRVTLTFTEVEAILHRPLPPYARQHRAFWSNDSVSHPQSRQWLDVDWRVATVDMANEVVVFSRIKEREKLYIDFFSTLLASLREKLTFPLRSVSPGGHSWLTIAGMPENGPQVAFLGFSFARNHRFRIELYIDTSSQERNKRVFDYLHARRGLIENQLLPEVDDTIHTPLAVRMSWERLDERRASRISLYCPGSITDNEAEWRLIIDWAASSTANFQQVMNQYLTDVIQANL